MSASVSTVGKKTTNIGAWVGFSYLNFTSIIAVYYLPNGSNIEALSAFEAIIYTFAKMHAKELSLDLSIDQAIPSFQAWRNSMYTMCNEAYESGGGYSDRTGSYGAIASWLMPKPLLQTIKIELAIAAAFMEILGFGMDSIVGMLLGERARSNVERDDNNAMNLAWRSALWHVVVVSTWTTKEACVTTQASKSWLVAKCKCSDARAHFSLKLLHERGGLQ
ncbi:hypothetical protein L7F22_053555 [Adiantum nelumboides]|nr:hypothetical protein [Adiantum nelumboides]